MIAWSKVREAKLATNTLEVEEYGTAIEMKLFLAKASIREDGSQWGMVERIWSTSKENAEQCAKVWAHLKYPELPDLTVEEWPYLENILDPPSFLIRTKR